MININTDSPDVYWIYGFPTLGKTTAQRTLRFMRREQRKDYHFEDAIDATDTDDWFGTFKMSQNPELHDEIYHMINESAKFTQRLRSNYCRVIFTNVWRIFAENNILPAAVFIPDSAKLIVERAVARGGKNFSWVTDNAQRWLDNITSSDWFHRQECVITVEGTKYISDYISINGVPLHHRCDLDRAMIEVDHNSVL